MMRPAAVGAKVANGVFFSKQVTLLVSTDSIKQMPDFGGDGCLVMGTPVLHCCT